MIFTFDKFTIDVDVERTHKFYKSAELITDGCKCDGCQNYEKAVDLFPESVRELFGKLGIDPKKPTEAYVNCSEESGKRLFYGGFYHLCGIVVNGDNAWISQAVDSTTTISHINEDYLYKISEGYFVTFSGGEALLENGVSEPIIVMDIEFHIPWVLDKENTYL